MTVMHITDIHEPEFVNMTRTYPRFTWRCSCGGFSAGPYYRSRSLAMIAYETDHRYPESIRALPPHNFVELEGGFGGVAWACSCGERGRPDGHADLRRAQQGHAQHVTATTMKWLEALHKHALARMTPQDRANREAILNWHRKDPATRATQTQYVLDQIL